MFRMNKPLFKFKYVFWIRIYEYILRIVPTFNVNRKIIRHPLVEAELKSAAIHIVQLNWICNQLFAPIRQSPNEIHKVCILQRISLSSASYRMGFCSKWLIMLYPQKWISKKKLWLIQLWTQLNAFCGLLVFV